MYSRISRTESWSGLQYDVSCSSRISSSNQSTRSLRVRFFVEGGNFRWYSCHALAGTGLLRSRSVSRASATSFEIRGACSMPYTSSSASSRGLASPSPDSASAPASSAGASSPAPSGAAPDSSVANGCHSVIPSRQARSSGLNRPSATAACNSSSVKGPCRSSP